MKIEINRYCKGIDYEDLIPGDVFSDRPLDESSPENIFIKPVHDSENAISLKNGDCLYFEPCEVVYLLNATLVINEE